METKTTKQIIKSIYPNADLILDKIDINDTWVKVDSLGQISCDKCRNPVGFIDRTSDFRFEYVLCDNCSKMFIELSQSNPEYSKSSIGLAGSDVNTKLKSGNDTLKCFECKNKLYQTSNRSGGNAYCERCFEKFK